jgi:pentatricopeptide repeat protein
MRSNDIRSCGRNGNLNGAIKVFERLGHERDNTLVLNSMIDACIESQEVEKALVYFNRARNLKLADAISYNRMMKGYLAQGQEVAAKQLLAELTQKGMANTTCYHGLMNARVNAGDLRGAWKLVAQMQDDGISPNAVTCAILLKGRLQSVEEVARVLALIDAMEEPMDEVLFMTVAEACIRIGRLDMLSRQMEKFKRQGSSGSLSAETYGSMIKAYGRARDTKRVWELWDQMASDGAQLTSVTLGCMVEALVANGQSIEAWQLVQDLLKDEIAGPLVNTVICSTILKGFAYAKDTEKVMAVYKEMHHHHIQPNTITFNTILNAFAQCGTMQYAPELLVDMRKATPAVEPDIVTYSTLVKGYCYAGCLDRALQVFKDMQEEGKCIPDEVLFNSLLGGCAKEFRLEEALQLLNDMRKSGIAPSNYTLSMVVKLMCRCRRLEQAFTMLEDISKEYNFKINIQVYTCLIQGCFHNWQPEKALTVYDKIINESLVPDSMTYTVLVRGCLRAGCVEKAAELVRHANGLSSAGPHKMNAAPGINAGCLEEVVAALGGGDSKQGSALLAEMQECAPARASSSRPVGQWPCR